MENQELDYINKITWVVVVHVFKKTLWIHAVIL